MPPKGRKLFFPITSNAHQFYCSFKHIFSQFHSKLFVIVRNFWPDTSRTTQEVQQNTNVVEEKRSGSTLLAIKNRSLIRCQLRNM